MRWMLCVATALTGCAALDKHVVDHDPPAGFCETLPSSFVAKYDDGSPFLEVKPIEGHKGASEATYYDRTGTPVLVERSVNSSVLYFAVYYPSGQKELAGAFRIEENRFVPQSHWERYEENGAPDTRELPDDFFDYRPMLIDGEGPDNYPEPRLYEGFVDNQCLLVCTDSKGGMVGAFPIQRGSDLFEESIRQMYSTWVFTPRRIGDRSVPACARIPVAIRS